mmetsp:Transcript_24605/g.40516  ORF Transcript_24605/g.40516 Transcript_24605/m.40516 type:complete len:206 (-) Transcript_24605:176-793(-)|eukprot:CAMPEP_0184336114 /NCGR_PEP_ID=MMETSP1089-20130417/4532_1 /TAXON_ID=38269 ORGANISM="Gloeochaete wittrockiana, Strain SAG46.84" /NCGR_SAMPLE_ID=MMETSP1089 /ASSEMBLY_ACC=CAM_ASM_000445 /LENGTH=205 /DNA_ID=CAMNT_0026661057 /DNA_START=97 /DNA_END=714 /DNA_ORIENTATION=+
MSKRKGLSLDDKRAKVQEIFHERASVFNLKEIEKIASKEKGVVLQTVKEVLQSLCDDGLVTTDKIGISNYFWALPSTALATRTTKIRKLKEDIATLEAQRDALNAQRSAAQKGRETSDDRETHLEEMGKLENKSSELDTQLALYRDMDPEVIRKVAEDGDTAKDSANRWTDNIFSIKKYCVEKFGMESGQFSQSFGIPDDLDYCS